MKKKRIEKNRYIESKIDKPILKATRQEWFKLFAILLLILGGTVWVAIYLTNKRNDEIVYIKNDYTLSKGVITKITVYKGRSVRVKYRVKDKYYIESDGMDKRLNKETGDSIYIKYSNKRPELMISECNNNW